MENHKRDLQVCVCTLKNWIWYKHSIVIRLLFTGFWTTLLTWRRQRWTKPFETLLTSGARWHHWSLKNCTREMLISWSALEQKVLAFLLFFEVGIKCRIFPFCQSPSFFECKWQSMETSTRLMALGGFLLTRIHLETPLVEIHTLMKMKHGPKTFTVQTIYIKTSNKILFSKSLSLTNAAFRK